ncbi:MAG TPA: M48 family metallopeptidase [Myxococcota bacterium]|jgi:predicted Zn-dependent protease|nr:M48 family metallopeptidase [Myxococcota bacterium]
MSPRCSRPGNRALALVGLLVALAGCASSLSVDDERRLAYQADREVRQQSVMVSDPVVNEYVDKIGQRIVATLPPNPYEFQFAVIDDDEINAFTPGAGFVYIHTAVLLNARNVSEVAGVMAHEIGHVMRRHVADNYVRSRNTGTLYQLGTVAAGVFGGPLAYDAAVLGGQLGALAALNTFTREDESEADAFAVPVLAKAGYDPNGLVTFFGTIKARYGDSSSFLSSHPAPSDRIDATKALIAELPPNPDLRVDDGGQLEIIQRRIRLLEKLRVQRRVRAR